MESHRFPCGFIDGIASPLHKVLGDGVPPNAGGTLVKKALGLVDIAACWREELA